MRKAQTPKPTRHQAHDVVAHKSPAKAATAAQEPAESTNGNGATLTLSAKTTRAIEAIKPALVAFSEDFKTLATNRAALAPKVMKAFGQFQAESGGSFVAFVRYIDPTVPADRDGYRNHNVYQAALYLRRLMAVAERPAKDPNAPKVTSPVDVVTDLLVTLQQVVVDMGDVWTLFSKRYHWTEKRIARLQKAVGEARQPLLVKSGQERKLHAA